MDFNRCEFAGRLVREHELRYTAKGTAVLDNTLAVNRSWKDASGQKQEEVVFVDFTAFGSTAEALTNYTTKASPIFITARFNLDKWEDKETGQQRSRPKFIVEAFYFLETATQQAERMAGAGRQQPQQGRGDNRGGNQRPAQQQRPQQGNQGGGYGGHQGGADDFDDDDIPF